MKNYTMENNELRSKISRKLGEAFLQEYKAKADQYEASKPPCYEGHDQKEWYCTGNYHMKIVEWMKEESL